MAMDRGFFWHAQRIFRLYKEDRSTRRLPICQLADETPQVGQFTGHPVLPLAVSDGHGQGIFLARTENLPIIQGGSEYTTSSDLSARRRNAASRPVHWSSRSPASRFGSPWTGDFFGTHRESSDYNRQIGRAHV